MPARPIQTPTSIAGLKKNRGNLCEKLKNQNSLLNMDKSNVLLIKKVISKFKKDKLKLYS